MAMQAPDKKFKGRDAIARSKLVGEVAAGLAEPHTLPLCSYEQSAWHAIGLFARPSGSEEQENRRSQGGERSDDIFVISHDYPHLPVAELAAGIAALQRPVNLLIQRTTILSLEARGEEANKQAFVRLLHSISRLHIRCCKNFRQLSAGVSSRQVSLGCTERTGHGTHAAVHCILTFGRCAQ